MAGPGTGSSHSPSSCSHSLVRTFRKLLHTLLWCYVVVLSLSSAMAGYVVITGDTFSRILRQIGQDLVLPSPFRTHTHTHTHTILTHTHVLPPLPAPGAPDIVYDEVLIKAVMVVAVMMPISMLRNIARLEKVDHVMTPVLWSVCRLPN